MKIQITEKDMSKTPLVKLVEVMKSFQELGYETYIKGIGNGDVEVVIEK